MIKTLIAITHKPDLHPLLYQRMLDLSDALIDDNPGFEIEIARRTDVVDRSGPYASPQALARNMLLDNCLKPAHEYVLWIDADIVEYPSDLLTRLYDVNPGGISAPVPLIEGGQQFYDTYGFVEDGERVFWQPPYFRQVARIVSLDCVGCVYLIPATVYHSGNRYAASPYQTEHWSINRAATKMGMTIKCDRELIVYHADLPKYGLAWNGH
jgi:hypothetical protein